MESVQICHGINVEARLFSNRPIQCTFPSADRKVKRKINLRARSTRPQHGLNHCEILKSHLRNNRTRRKDSSREKRASKQRAGCIF